MICVPIIRTLVEVAEVGIGGDDSTHRTDIKAKQRSSNYCHCSDSVPSSEVSLWLELKSILSSLLPIKDKKCVLSIDLHVDVTDLITHLEYWCQQSVVVSMI